MMKNLIRLISEQLEGQGDNPLSEKEIRLFKYINKQGDSAKKKNDLLKLFKTMMPMIGRPESDARFYYEIYTANYRPEGDYENLDKSTFKHYREFKQRRTPNNSAYEYSVGKIPFKGSNIEGFWDVNDKNQWYYVIESYGWYPVYLFINNQWYKVSNSYSSSTSKQMAGANPIRRYGYDQNIKQQIITVTPDEIKSIRDGKSMDDIKTKRLTLFMDRLGNEMNMVHPQRMITIGWGNDKKKVKFTIKDVREGGGKINFTIRIDKAGTVEGTNRMIVNPEGYVVPSPFSEDIENGIEQRIISDYNDFLKSDNTSFKFYHPKSN
jgi:hypothetical protein